MKPCLSTLFDQYDGLWSVFTAHNFTQRFDLQGHARAQIFIYKDVSVCNVSSPNFHMFYDKRRVSTQISRSRLSNVTCLYKIVSTATRDDEQVFIKKARLCTILTYEDVSMSNFQHMWTWLSGNFPWLWTQDRTMRRVVVSRSSWMVFIFYGGYAHVFSETYGWEKPR